MGFDYREKSEDGCVKGQTGTSLGGIEVSPRRIKSNAKKRRKEEALWRSKNGEVVITKKLTNG